NLGKIAWQVWQEVWYLRENAGTALKERASKSISATATQKMPFETWRMAVSPFQWRLGQAHACHSKGEGKTAPDVSASIAARTRENGSQTAGQGSPGRAQAGPAALWRSL